METLPRALAARLGDAALSSATVTELRRRQAEGESWFEVELFETISAKLYGPAP